MKSQKADTALKTAQNASKLLLTRCVSFLSIHASDTFVLSLRLYHEVKKREDVGETAEKPETATETELGLLLVTVM